MKGDGAGNALRTPSAENFIYRRLATLNRCVLRGLGDIECNRFFPRTRVAAGAHDIDAGGCNRMSQCIA